jgi:hypothetical protein
MSKALAVFFVLVDEQWNLSGIATQNEFIRFRRFWRQSSLESSLKIRFVEAIENIESISWTSRVYIDYQNKAGSVVTRSFLST